jgi:hypothetical protein
MRDDVPELERAQVAYPLLGVEYGLRTPDRADKSKGRRGGKPERGPQYPPVSHSSTPCAGCPCNLTAMASVLRCSWSCSGRRRRLPLLLLADEPRSHETQHETEENHDERQADDDECGSA